MSRSISKGGVQEGGGDETMRLEKISIPQQIAWTGIPQDNSARKAQTGTAFAMEGLVLWNILGFSLGNTRDYGCISAVNKEWNQIVKTMEPPVMFQMKAVLERDVRCAVKTEDLDLLKSGLQMLENKESPLYLKERGNQRWPHLQPQFSMILMRLVYRATNQRSPWNQSFNVYELVCNYLNDISTKTGEKMLQTLAKTGVTPTEKLQKFVADWSAWEGIVCAVVGIAGCLDRHLIKRRMLKPLAEHGQTCLVSGLLSSHDFPCLLGQFLDDVNSNITSMPRALLMHTYKACKALDSFPPVVSQKWNGNAGISEIQASFSQTKAKVEEILLPEEQEHGGNPDHDKENIRLGLTIVFPNGTKLHAPRHFVDASGLLYHLHLSDGECMRWHDDQDIPRFVKALEFYAMDAQTPMPPIEPISVFSPLHSTDLRIILGEENAHFARLVDSLTQMELDALISFVDFLNLEKLRDLCVTAFAAQNWALFLTAV